MNRDFLSKSAARLPVKWMRQLSGVTLVVPYYHIVSDEVVPHVNHLYRFRTIAEFTADVEFFMRHFEPVTLDDIVQSLNGSRTLPRFCFHLTFDDGFREIHDIVAPLLQSAGAPATFFLNTAYLNGGGLQHHNALSVLLDRIKSHQVGEATLRFVDSILPAPKSNCTTLQERLLSIHFTQKTLVQSLSESLEVDFDLYVRQTQPYLTFEQIGRLVRWGFTIGGHGHEHPLYADLSLTQQLAQTQTSMQLLETRFGLNPKAFAFPHTDRGVDGTFFKAVFSELLLDISFGTAGLVPHFHPRNIERVRMEGTPAPAAEILARQYARAMYLRLSRH
jgi:peptidoglycan/xylan/chitin deacetylase (PgdA/CDA1 family)